MTIDLKQLQIQCISLIINTMNLKNERLAYIVLREYLNHAHENHTAQKVSKWAGKVQDQMFAHQQQDPTDSYKYLLCASSFEANEALVCWGAAVSLTHTEHRRISLQDEQRITGFGFSFFF